MAFPHAPAERHRTVSAGFAERVQAVPDWSAPAPVPGWTALDVVDHLVTWLPQLLAAGDVQLAAGPPVADDPIGAWESHSAAVQALLDDPVAATAPFRHPQIGEFPLAEAIDRFYTADVFMHTWDLARAGGLDERLDPDFCAQLLAGMTPIEQLLRSSGQYGPAVPVADDADVQTRMIAFIGRDPAWAIA